MTQVIVEPQETGWFPPEISPRYEGVYRLNEPWFADGVYAYWNGRRFGYRTMTVAEAYRNQGAATTLSPRAAWRGLAHDPQL
jgi:hypothetical protein